MKHVFLGFGLALSLSLSGCTCGTTDCTPGKVECSCREGQCDDGAVCGANNTCVAGTVVGVQVSEAGARGCEVLFTEQPGTTVVGARFSGGVVGTSIREAPRTAVSFVAAGDSSFPSGGVQLTLSAGTTAGVTVSKVKCVDAAGNALPTASISVR